MPANRLNEIFQLKDAELALARAQGVDVEGMPLHRARVRNLRNFNCPPVPKPGSGQRIGYSHGNIIQLLIALEVELLGLSPTTAAMFSKSAMSSDWLPVAEQAAAKFRDYYLGRHLSFTDRDGDGGIFISPKKPLSSCRLGYINIGQSIFKLNMELKRVSRLP